MAPVEGLGPPCSSVSVHFGRSVVMQSISIVKQCRGPTEIDKKILAFRRGFLSCAADLANTIVQFEKQYFPKISMFLF